MKWKLWEKRHYTFNEAICEPGSLSRDNEDGYLVDKNFFMVVDGATGVTTPLVAGNQPLTPKWLTQQIIARIKIHYVGHFYGIENPASALQRIADQIVLDHPVIAKEEFRLRVPSAAVAGISRNRNQWYGWRLGDCEIFYENEKGEIHSLFPASTLKALDQKLISKMMFYINRGLSPEEARKTIRPSMITNRSLANRSYGYGIFRPEKGTTKMLEIKMIPKNSPAILIASDGFAALKDYNREIFDNAVSGKRLALKEALEIIRGLESNDPSLTIYPRLKRSDDATAIRVLLGASHV